jgi:hypothetical protein
VWAASNQEAVSKPDPTGAANGVISARMASGATTVVISI